jgi:dTDP-4-dehydrorhamnose reductase
MTTILLTGRTGQTGSELQQALAPLGQVIATGRGELDLADPDSIRAAIRQAKPSIIVNAGAFTSVDDVERQPELAMRVNGVAPGVIAEETRRLSGLLVHYSTSYVFDGDSPRPYLEDDPPNPINAYGSSKLAGEQAIAAAGCDHLILRTSWIYGARGINFLTTFLKLAREKKELPVVDDQIGSPTWARAIAEATAELLRRKEDISRHGGVYHLAAGGHTSRYEFARAIIDLMKEVSGIPDGWASVKPIATTGYPLPAKRPRNSVLSKDKIERAFGIALPHWRNQLHTFLRELATTGN